MENTLPDLNGRLKKIIDTQTDGNVSKFADLTGFSQQKLNRLFIIDTRTEKYPTVTIDIVSKITEMFVSIDPDWLLNGRGEMYRSQNTDHKHLFPEYYDTKNAKNVTIENGNRKGNAIEAKPKMQKKLPFEINPYILRTDSKKESQVIPLYNMEASAGLVQLLDNHSSQSPIDYISIPNLPNCDGALFVTGDSMYPLLKSGDIIAYKQVEDIENDIFWGEMYLVSVDVGGEELVTIKYIQKSEKEGYIKLVSQNKHHQDKDVKIAKIRALAIIKASIRYNLMS